MNKKEAWNYYKTWMKETTYSKALESNIRITRKGWDHLVYGSKSKRRLQSDIHNKLKLLKYAKKIIKDKTTFTTSIRNKTKFYVITEKKGKTEIRVLISRDLKGNYIFHSVMKH